MTPNRQSLTIHARKTLLQLLQNADGWVVVDTITTVHRLRYHIANMEKMGLVETTKWSGSENEPLVRITMSGRHALSRGEFVFRHRKVNVLMASDIHDDAKKLAEELEVNGIAGVLRAVLGRREAFIRWYHNIYAEELSK